MPSRLSEFPSHGFGVGLRRIHYPDFLKNPPPQLGWVEVISENFCPLNDGRPTRPIKILERVRAERPVALHGVSLSLGSSDPLNPGYLKRLRGLADRISPCWISDHLCWTSIQGENLHDLLPLPYSEEALALVIDRVKQVQDFLGRRILLENVSSYVDFTSSTLTEWDFLSEVLEKADCGLLLDINNIYVSSVNHQFDPMQYLRSIPLHRVGQIHLAGHTDRGSYLIDTHDEPVCDAVWQLYRWAARHCGAVSTMIEWDDNFPTWLRLLEEVARAETIWKEENAKILSSATSASI